MYRASKKRGDWSLNAQVTSTVDPDQPGAPEALQSSVSGGVVTFSARAAENDAATGNTAVLIFRRGTTSQAFGSAFGLKRLKAGPNDVRTITNTPGSGTWRYWCAGENVSKVVGPPSYIDVVVP